MWGGFDDNANVPLDPRVAWRQELYNSRVPMITWSARPVPSVRARLDIGEPDISSAISTMEVDRASSPRSANAIGNPGRTTPSERIRQDQTFGLDESEWPANFPDNRYRIGSPGNATAQIPAANRLSYYDERSQPSPTHFDRWTATSSTYVSSFLSSQEKPASTNFRVEGIQNRGLREPDEMYTRRFTQADHPSQRQQRALTIVGPVSHSKRANTPGLEIRTKPNDGRNRELGSTITTRDFEKSSDNWIYLQQDHAKPQAMTELEERRENRKRRYGTGAGVDLGSQAAVNMSLDEVISQNNITYSRTCSPNSLSGNKDFQRGVSHPKKFKMDEESEDVDMEDSCKLDYSAPGFSLHTRGRKRSRARPVVIDGFGVGFDYGNNVCFDWEGIDLIVHYFLELGCCDIKVVVPEERILTSGMSKNEHLLKSLQAGHYLLPAWESRDPKLYIVRAAYNRDGILISNDVWKYIRSGLYSKLKNSTLTFDFQKGSKIRFSETYLGETLDDILWK